MQDSLTDNYQNLSIKHSYSDWKQGDWHLTFGFNSSSTTAVHKYALDAEIPATGRWHMNGGIRCLWLPMPGILRMPEQVNDGTWNGSCF